MSSVNKVILVGRLGADPELHTTNGGRTLCRMNIATNRKYTTANGENKEEVAWHRVVTWGEQAKTCKKYLCKGKQIYVEGRLRHSQYKDNDGQKKHSTEVVSQAVVFLGSKPSSNEPQVIAATGDRVAEFAREDMPF